MNTAYKWLILLLLCTAPAFAQNVRVDNVTFSSVQGFPFLPGATITICTAAATGLPCSPTVAGTCLSISDTTCNQSATLTSDALGNYGFWIQPGSYSYTVTKAGFGGFGPKALTLSCQPASTCTITGPQTVSAAQTNTGDLFATSGRPTIDVMGKGAKNDNSTDDTAFIQAAITAACAFSPTGAVVYFPRGAGYKTANTSTTPFIIPAGCVGITFRGSGWSTADVPEPPSTILGPNLTAPMFSVPNALNGLVRFEELGISGNPASATAVGISVTANTSGVINHVFFDQWGGSAINITGLFGWWIDESWAQNCLEVRPASTDTGCFDLSNNDNELHANFVTTSSGTAAGNIGTGHSYAYAIRGSNGFFRGNQGELSQHGWLVTGNDNTFIGNRATLNQGNGFHCQGQNNIFVGNKALNNSQTATGSFDGFLNDSTCVGGIFADSIIDDPGGNGNHTRHGFTDANSNGGTYTLANHYSNNHFGHLGTPTGVLYNMTGSSPYAIQQPHVSSGFLGDVSITIQAGVDFETQVFNTVLTANRTVTLSTTGAWQGARFRIIRTSGATGAFNLTIVAGPGAVLQPGEFVDVEFTGGQWNYVAGGTVDGTYRSGTLIPTISGTTDIGSATNPFVNLHISAGANPFNITPANPASARTISLPDPGTNTNLALNLRGSVAGSTTLLAANSCGDTVTLAITGATTSMDAHASGAVSTGLVPYAWVSSANTVSIEYCNVTTAGITPSAATFQVTVTP